MSPKLVLNFLLDVDEHVLRDIALQVLGQLFGHLLQITLVILTKIYILEIKTKYRAMVEEGGGNPHFKDNGLVVLLEIIREHVRVH